MGAHGCDAALIHKDDAVRILYGSYALGNDDLGGFGDVFAQCFSNVCIGLRIHGAGRIIQYKDLGLFEQRARNA